MCKAVGWWLWSSGKSGRSIQNHVSSLISKRVVFVAVTTSPHWVPWDSQHPPQGPQHTSEVFIYWAGKESKNRVYCFCKDTVHTLSPCNLIPQLFTNMADGRAKRKLIFIYRWRYKTYGVSKDKLAQAVTLIYFVGNCFEPRSGDPDWGF